MKSELSEVKVTEFQNSSGLDTSIRRSFERLQEGKLSQAEKKLAPDIRQSFEQFQKDVSESEKIGSGAAKSFEKLEPESGTRYNDSGAHIAWSKIFCLMQSTKGMDMSIRQTTLEDFSQRKEIFT